MSSHVIFDNWSFRSDILITYFKSQYVNQTCLVERNLNTSPPIHPQCYQMWQPRSLSLTPMQGTGGMRTAKTWIGVGAEEGSSRQLTVSDGARIRAKRGRLDHHQQQKPISNG